MGGKPARGGHDHCALTMSPLQSSACSLQALPIRRAAAAISGIGGSRALSRHHPCTGPMRTGCRRTIVGDATRGLYGRGLQFVLPRLERLRRRTEGATGSHAVTRSDRHCRIASLGLVLAYIAVSKLPAQAPAGTNSPAPPAGAGARTAAAPDTNLRASLDGHVTRLDGTPVVSAAVGLDGTGDTTETVRDGASSSRTLPPVLTSSACAGLGSALSASRLCSQRVRNGPSLLCSRVLSRCCQP